MTAYVFNAASNEGDNGGADTAILLVKQFVEILAELDAQTEGPACALKLPRDAWDLTVTLDEEGNAVSLGEIINDFYDDAATRDLAAFFDALRIYAPAEEELDSQAVEAILRLTPTSAVAGYEGVFDAVLKAGYEAMQCVVTGGTLVSFGNPLWDFNLGTAVCGTTTVSFDHASNLVHVRAIVDRVNERFRTSISRRNFSDVRSQVFPSLIWGQDVDSQMAVFPSEFLGLAFKRLASLNEVAKEWALSKSAEPDRTVIEFKGESDLTMDNYGEARRFRSASGDVKVYETHISIDRGNRIHVILDKVGRTIEVGYIGKHLKTWKF